MNLLVVLSAMWSSTALGQATPVGEFVGEWSETWPGPQEREPCLTMSGGQLCSTDMIETIGWSYSCTIYPWEGDHFVGSAANGGPATYTIDGGTLAFGGYFGQNATASAIAATVTFYDAVGSVVDSVISPLDGCGAWKWLGWELSTPVYSIEVALTYSDGTLYDDGSHAMMDDLRFGIGALPTFVISDGGTCPNNVTIDIGNLTPNGTYYLIHSDLDGSTVIPSGSCAGVTLPVSGPKFRSFTADGLGQASHSWYADSWWCGRSALVLDATTCQISDVDVVGP